KAGGAKWKSLLESEKAPYAAKAVKHKEILDDGSVSAKLRKKSKNELLVRLYGTYEYMYVDATKSNYEFEDVLKRENKTMKEMFQEALEQDMSLMLPKGQSKLES
ncbi:uncharacterized protein LOC144546114, partial [Carex rostrata]